LATPSSNILPAQILEYLHRLVTLRLEDCAMEMRPTGSESFSLVQCLDSVEKLVTRSWASDISVEFQSEADVTIFSWTRASFEAAILHLLLNARDAVPNGGAVSVHSSVSPNAYAAKELEIRVKDNGYGMTTDMLLHATDPYFTTKATGLGGFGLHMVRQFAERVGGHLHLDSTLGLGTIATLQLPLKLDLEAAAVSDSSAASWVPALGRQHLVSTIP
jgi:signal transduction histidine kinase